MSKANEQQFGGDHYKIKTETGGEEHWDRVYRLGLDYWQANITKYVERCWKKNGIEDLLKARHYIEKYIELKEAENKSKIRDVRVTLGTARYGVEEGMLVRPGQMKPTGWTQFIYEGGSRKNQTGPLIDFFRCRECLEHFECLAEVNPHTIHTSCHRISDEARSITRPIDVTTLFDTDKQTHPPIAGTEPEPHGYVDQDEVNLGDPGDWKGDFNVRV